MPLIREFAITLLSAVEAPQSEEILTNRELTSSSAHIQVNLGGLCLKAEIENQSNDLKMI